MGNLQEQIKVFQELAGAHKYTGLGAEGRSTYWKERGTKLTFSEGAISDHCVGSKPPTRLLVLGKNRTIILV